MSGKTVLITGAGSGFGKMAAVSLATKGHHVIATTQTDEQAHALTSEHPNLTVETLDITTEDVRKVSNWNIDVLVNNAGMGITGPMADLPMESLRQIFEVNVFGTVRMTQEALKQMIPRKSGRIIILSSIAGALSAPTFGPYSMTKFALEAMGKALRGEVASAGVDVTLLNPGPYNTGFNDRMANSMWEWFSDASLNSNESDMFRSIGEFVVADQGDPQEVADKIVELCEAETTEVNNWIPESIKGLVGL